MKGHVDKSMEIVTLITEVLTKINPKILRVPVEEQISKCFEMENGKSCDFTFEIMCFPITDI